jgi:DNA-binding NarL/FixJ family response regulator
MLDKLSTREQQVAKLLMKGVSNKEIARALDVEVVTAKRHVGNILRKLGARNRTQAALCLAEGKKRQAKTIAAHGARADRGGDGKNLFLD